MKTNCNYGGFVQTSPLYNVVTNIEQEDEELRWQEDLPMEMRFAPVRVANLEDDDQETQIRGSNYEVYFLTLNERIPLYLSFFSFVSSMNCYVDCCCYYIRIE